MAESEYSHPYADFRERPWTVCFYSFRGGVGRTTLLLQTCRDLFLPGAPSADVAVLDPATGTTASLLDEVLARIKKGLVIDFDLEAPGIDEFAWCRPPAPQQKGLIEYITDYQDHGCAPRLCDYVYHAAIPDDAVPPTCYVMRAGRRGDRHRRFVATFDWESFYRDKEGYLFFESLLVGAHKEFGCEYVLLDSRTGLTEIGSVCTGHLADAVVLVFEPNAAHGDGIAQVARAIRLREQREQRPIPRLYVASKAWESSEGELAPEAVQLAEYIIRNSEDSSQFITWDQQVDEQCDMGIFGEHFDPSVAMLTYIPRRDNVKCQHQPDGYLLPRKPLCIDALTPLERAYDRVATWVYEAVDAVRFSLNCQREKRAREQKLQELVTILRALTPKEIYRLLSGNPEKWRKEFSYIAGESAESAEAPDIEALRPLLSILSLAQRRAVGWLLFADLYGEEFKRELERRFEAEEE